MKPGDVISLYPGVGPKAMSTPRPLTKNQSDHQQLQVLRRAEVSTNAELDKGRRIIEKTDPEAEDSNLVTQKRTVGGTNLGWNNAENRPETTHNKWRADFNLNQRGLNRGKAAGAGFGVIIEAANFALTMKRLYDITEYLNKRDELVRRIKAESKIVVPEPPKGLLKVIARLREIAKITKDETEKRKAAELIARFSIILEQSYAFHGK